MNNPWAPMMHMRPLNQPPPCEKVIGSQRDAWGKSQLIWLKISVLMSNPEGNVYMTETEFPNFRFDLSIVYDLKIYPWVLYWGALLLISLSELWPADWKGSNIQLIVDAVSVATAFYSGQLVCNNNFCPVFSIC